MNIASLVLFVITIIIAFFRKSNIGILALLIGTIAIRLFGLPDKDLINGLNIGLFATLAGITLLFAIVTRSGALDLLARKIIALAGKRLWLIPILIFIAGWVISGVGPGGIPALAIIPPMAVAIAYKVGFNPVMLVLIGINGMTSGRFSGITPESAVILGAVSKTGMTGNVIPAIFINIVLTSFIFSTILYFGFGGYKVKAVEGNVESEEEIPGFSAKQLIALGSIFVMLILIVGFKLNIALAAFSVAAVLLMFHMDDDGACIKMIPWPTILMVLGVGTLLGVVNKMGGLKLMNDALAAIMTSGTATPIMGISAGLLSLVSSALGVVYPTMMPLCPGIAQQVGNVNPVALMSAVAAGGTMAGTSPMSTGGALIIAAIAAADKEFTKEKSNKVFVQLLVLSAASLILLAICAAVFYGPIAAMLYHV